MIWNWWHNYKKVYTWNSFHLFFTVFYFNILLSGSDCSLGINPFSTFWDCQQVKATQSLGFHGQTEWKQAANHMARVTRQHWSRGSVLDDLCRRHFKVHSASAAVAACVWDLVWWYVWNVRNACKTKQQQQKTRERETEHAETPEKKASKHLQLQTLRQSSCHD